VEAFQKGFAQLERLELSGWPLISREGLAKALVCHPGLEIAYAGEVISTR
jgi:hypothetical protein